MWERERQREREEEEEEEEEEEDQDLSTGCRVSYLLTTYTYSRQKYQLRYKQINQHSNKQTPKSSRFSFFLMHQMPVSLSLGHFSFRQSSLDWPHSFQDSKPSINPSTSIFPVTRLPLAQLLLPSYKLTLSPSARTAGSDGAGCRLAVQTVNCHFCSSEP